MARVEGLDQLLGTGAPSATPANRAVSVRARADNVDGDSVPGMLAGDRLIY